MPRPCIICSDTKKLAKAAKLIAAGNSDQADADALNAMAPDAPPMYSWLSTVTAGTTL
jgi:hypothetical protein